MYVVVVALFVLRDVLNVVVNVVVVVLLVDVLLLVDTVVFVKNVVVVDLLVDVLLLVDLICDAYVVVVLKVVVVVVDRFVDRICDEILSAFEYGLKLIGQKSTITEIEITEEGVISPVQFINDKVNAVFKIDD